MAVARPCLSDAERIGATIGALKGDMTITNLIEAVIIVVVILVAVRFFRKRG